MFSRAFHAGRWAEAFLAFAGNDAEEAYSCLKAFAVPIKSARGVFFGHGASAKLEKMLRDDTGGNTAKAVEYVIRFLCLLTEKKCLSYIDLLLQKLEEKIDEKNGIAAVTIEATSPLESGFETELTQAIKERTGAKGIKMKTVIKPELLGGYKLRAGSFYIDASLKGQLEKMSAYLNMAVQGRQ